MSAVHRLVHSLRAGSALLTVALLACAAQLAPAAQAAPGDLDPSFGIGGKEKILQSNGAIKLTAIATQPDGKIVLAGSGEGADRLLVARLNEDGSLDQSFGKGGTAQVNIFEGSPVVRAVAIQPDGKIVVAGSVHSGVDRDFLAVRFTTGGEPDLSFGSGGGVEKIPVGAGDDEALAVAIGQGGRILLTGSAKAVPPAPPGVEVGVAVLKEDGKPDPSFDGDGVKTLATTGEERDDEGVAIAEQPDGAILLADESGNGRGNGFTIIRLLAGGGLDPSFGIGGIANTPIPNATGPQNLGRVLDLALLPDGRIVAAGYGFAEAGGHALDQQFAAARYFADGKLDPSFGGAGTGIFTGQFSPEEDDRAQDVNLTAGGRVVLSGPYVNGSDGTAVVRLDSSGVIDPEFVTGGVPSSWEGEYHDGRLDSKGRLVIVSTANEAGGTTSVEVTRLLGGEPALEPPVVPPGPPPPADKSSQPDAKAPAPQPLPQARMKAVPRKQSPDQLTAFSGTATDSGGALAKVQIAVVELTATRAGRAATCRELANAHGRFKVVKAVRGNCPLLWLDATGTAKWRFKLKATLPIGRYAVYARAVDASGATESSFSRAARNRFGFRLLAP